MKSCIYTYEKLKNTVIGIVSRKKYGINIYKNISKATKSSMISFDIFFRLTLGEMFNEAPNLTYYMI